MQSKRGKTGTENKEEGRMRNRQRGEMELWEGGMNEEDMRRKVIKDEKLVGKAGRVLA